MVLHGPVHGRVHSRRAARRRGGSPSEGEGGRGRGRIRQPRVASADAPRYRGDGEPVRRSKTRDQRPPFLGAGRVGGEPGGLRASRPPWPRCSAWTTLGSHPPPSLARRRHVETTWYDPSWNTDRGGRRWRESHGGKPGGRNESEGEELLQFICRGHSLPICLGMSRRFEQ